ncbi:MAG: right-handed parallel beta-helix repeat-containing protein, partial [Desulfuromonadaceae bacterium]|nr:right-handed parallel beta-helix repeat-containing protein [Desulfuromonadaceae bacterium]
MRHYTNYRFIPPLFFLFLAQLIFNGELYAAVLIADTTWQGDITISEDVVVREGVTLTIKAGTTVHVVSSESTKTDPEYISQLTEITVRGSLKIEGTEKQPVEFAGLESKTGSWAGIFIDKGRAVIHSCRIRNADTALYLIDGAAEVYDSAFMDGRYGVVAQGETSTLELHRSKITRNDYGLFGFQNARVSVKDSNVTANRKKESYSASVNEVAAELRDSVKPVPPVSRNYKDEVFRGDTVWQGRIEIDGVVRVPEGSRLIILPGTIVEFRKKDTAGTGIGQNGLMIQGRIIAKGTPEDPIIFRSAELDKKAGDWDSINIMNSASAQNLIENCRIENAYRALHFHFSHVGLYNSTLTGNYRGIQFQESLVVFKGNRIYGNKSGLQGRDSDVTLENNRIYANNIGANLFRTNLTASGNSITLNSKEGVRIREGVSSLENNLIDGNRFGLMVADMFYGEYSGNVVTNNLEVGMSLKNADNLEVTDNFISGNGLNGLSIQESRAKISGNQISDNGERGIGVQSFGGEITGNNFVKNKLYAIDLEGEQNVDASGNWWGGEEPAKVVFDWHSDPSRGKVVLDNSAKTPFRFNWPLETVPVSAVWRGVTAIPRSVTVLHGAELKVAPGTEVEFTGGAGMLVKGRLIADGTADEKIRFTSVQKKGAGDWGEVQLEYAVGSRISNCIFEYATWGLHSHFTNLLVDSSLFSNNYGGMRFRSGPAEIRNSL